jgi:hypothetical protein
VRLPFCRVSIVESASQATRPTDRIWPIRSWYIHGFSAAAINSSEGCGR